MLAHVILRDPAGVEHDLVHGDLVGRLWNAALPLEDGRISEAHAMVSLREGRLNLVALRGGLAVDGRAASQVPLGPGLRVSLARGVELEVVEVWLPSAVSGVEGPHTPRQMLPPVCSVLRDPGPRVVAGWREEAELHLWSTGAGWMARYGSGAPQPVGPGTELPVGGDVLRLVEIPLESAGRSVTRHVEEAAAPLHLVAHFDSVHIHRAGHPAVVLGGKPARLLSELVAFDGPVSWGILSEMLWPDEADAFVRRGRLDVVLTRVRRKLRACGIRADLVSSDGAGRMSLVLYPDDRVEDRS